MKNRFKIFGLAVAAFTAVASLCVTGHSALETFNAILDTGPGWAPFLVFGACNELNAFRMATESLDQDIGRSTRLGRAMYFRNMFPKGTFVRNQGVTRSTFTIKPTEPADDQSLWQNVALSGNLTTPGCSPTFEDIGVDFFERTYGPKRRDFRGPVLCKEHFQFQHSIDDFIAGYVDELGKVLARTWEFGLRGDVMRLGDWFVDGNKIVGPNAVLTAGRPFQGLTQDMLDEVAIDAINTGVVPENSGGYILNGAAGPIYPLYIDMKDSANILKANSTIREDARFASEGKDGEGDIGLFRAIGATRVINNFRHIPTNIAPRFNFAGGVLVPVSPFKDITVVGTDQEILTTAYKNAPFAAALMAVPSGFTVEVVKPQTAGLNFKPGNYNGEWEFIIGGNKICDPPVYDPRGEKGRHFAAIQYAARPNRIHDLKVIIYKRCPTTSNRIFCS